QEFEEYELLDVPEINVDYILAAYMENVGDWYNSLSDENKLSMSAADKETPPQGEGWVFQLLGYTFNAEYDLYVLHKVLPRFQTDALRKEGITHAVLTWREVDREWTPAMGSEKLVKATKISAVVKKFRQ